MCEWRYVLSWLHAGVYDGDGDGDGDDDDAADSDSDGDSKDRYKQPMSNQ